MAFERNGSLTIEQIRETEKKIGHKIPEDYKEFLLKTNGVKIILHGLRKSEKKLNVWRERQEQIRKKN